MWYPRNKLFTTDRFDSTNTGEYIYTSFSGQNTLGGQVSLRNMATGANVIVPPGEPWPAMSWDKAYNFSLLWEANSGEWEIINASRPAVNQVYGTIGLTGNSRVRKAIHFSFSTGIVVEGAVYIPRLTGIVTGTWDNYYGLLIQDNNNDYESVRMQLNPTPGFIVGYGSTYETFVPATGLGNQIISFRYGARGNTGQFITSQGYSVLMTGITRQNLLTGTPYTGSVMVGNLTDLFTGTNTDTLSRTDLARLYYKTPAFDIAGDFIADTYYDTNVLTLTTPEFIPDYIPEALRSVIVRFGGTEEICNGTTKVSVYHRATPTASWTILASGTYSRTDAGLIRSFSVPYQSLSRNGTDMFRCEIAQNSADGTQPPPPIEYLTLAFTEERDGGWLNIEPRFGSSQGEYPVLISINPNYQGHKRVTTEALSNVVFQCNLTGEIVSHKDIVTNTVFGGHYLSSGLVPLTTGLYNNPVQNWRNLIYRPSVLDQLFTGKQGNLYEGIDYKTRIIGNNGIILASNNFEYLLPVGNMSGVSTGTVGYALDPYSLSSATNPQDRLYGVEILQFPSLSGQLHNYITQSYAGPAGHGVVSQQTELYAVTGYTHIVVENIIQVSEGRLCIGLSGATNLLTNTDRVSTYSKYGYGVPQRVRSIFPANVVTLTGTADPNTAIQTGVFKIGFFGVGDDLRSPVTGQQASFKVAGTKIYAARLAQITTATNSNWVASPSTLDAWFKTDGHSNTGSSLVRVDHVSDGYYNELLIDKHGYPVLSVNDGTRYEETGVNSIDTTRWHHLAYNYNTGQSRYDMWLDGRYQGGLPISHISSEVDPTIKIGAGFVGAIQLVRYRNASIHPSYMQVFDSHVAPLKFHSEYQLPITGQPCVRYKFDKGGYIDVGTGRSAHLLVPDSGDAAIWTVNDGEGVFGEAAAFLGSKGSAKSKFPVAFHSDNAYIGFHLAAVRPDQSNNPRILKFGSLTFDLLSGKYIRLTHTGQYNYTGATDISSNFGWGWFAFDYGVVGEQAYLTGYYCTGVIGEAPVTVEFSGTKTSPIPLGFTGVIEVGHSPTGTNDEGDIYLDDLGIYAQRLPDRYWLDITTGKGKHSEHVSMNDIRLDEDRVRHIGVYTKEVVIPPQSNFNITGYANRLKVNVSHIGTLDVGHSFNYVGIRNVSPDLESKNRLEESRNKLCKTNSPIRIGNTSPRGAVNIAYITTQDLSIENNLSFLDASDSNAENFVNPLNSYQLLAAITGQPTNPAATHAYTGQVNTDDILVTTYAMMRKDNNFIAPLFFKHLIGMGRYYVYQLGATGESNATLATIRDGLRLYDQNGSSIPIEEFPFDVRISTLRDDKRGLPRNIYSVDLLTRDRFIEGKTVFVEYEAADPLNNYEPIRGHREVINPEPIFVHLDRTKLFLEESFTTIDSDHNPDIADRKYNVGPVITVYHRTGDWDPSIHKKLINTDDIRF